MFLPPPLLHLHAQLQIVHVTHVKQVATFKGKKATCTCKALILLKPIPFYFQAMST